MARSDREEDGERLKAVQKRSKKPKTLEFLIAKVKGVKNGFVF